ncbi:Asparagine synthase [Seinonella peptonophila]|uniref:asparagine synthase (glutamine-hydrolyzing) n=1 Tax=Seinonella peptonophila TaxID=112248 RepID=A0A1M4VD60_9BACL|nr:asparagine synthase-related protein [Seinonella peptonophila]SHE66853.1 Asparagine synthase [Seinonella peptonophila]
MFKRCSGEFYSDASTYINIEGEIWGGPSKLLRIMSGKNRDSNQAFYKLIQEDYSILKEIDGAFLLAFYDHEHKKGLLYKSLVCQKSLFYRYDTNGLFFSSDIGEVLRDKPLLSQVNKNNLLPLVLGDILNKDTYFNDVYRLTAGNVLIFEEGKIRIECLDYLEQGIYKEKSMEDFINLASEIMRTTIRKRLDLQDPIGVILSGGMDSSSVAAFLKKEGHQVEAFHWSFSGTPADESRYAKDVANFLSIPFTEIDGIELINKASYLPKWNQLIPYNHGYYELYQKTITECKKRGLKAIATGNLGDNIFGGNDSVSIKTIFKNFPFQQALRYIYEAWGTPKIKEDSEIHPRYKWYAPILTEKALDNINTQNILQDQASQFVALSDIDRDMILSESEGDIRFFDLFSSKELMEWSLSLPSVYKDLPTGGQWVDKFIQRAMFIDVLPPSCIARNHKQVMTAFHEIYVIRNRDQVTSILNEQAYLTQFNIIDPIKIKSMENNQLALSASALIACCMVELWLKKLEREDLKNVTLSSK